MGLKNTIFVRNRGATEDNGDFWPIPVHEIKQQWLTQIDRFALWWRNNRSTLVANNECWADILRQNSDFLGLFGQFWLQKLGNNGPNQINKSKTWLVTTLGQHL